MIHARGRNKNMDSILNSTKKMLGLGEEYTVYDADIIALINSAFSVLTQLGVGPNGGFSIDDEDAVWDDFCNAGTLLSMVKTYIFMKVKLTFDPPTSASVLDAMKTQISELEWRLNVHVDPVDFS